ncbi:TPA: nucleotide exchange factor GrpE [Candidatus Peribacteria bacterium]|nr:MAG: nucleotide exchange factor GrpE [Candidatus Peribacteria bacterium RIFOXYC2_FULL_58_10]OGJ84567.1 MAG: nucleotide exchange factor GrpE [Candidatus Peribacteria bacterium RIFOXYD2_FULL_58_15]HAI98338.1 nucleotide exchange factor GrpE [Candidatus Peribacteria bacterium]HAS33759.1 nucleotide exchange factor GrpE [Candidatus Peribacteria bacterium]
MDTSKKKKASPTAVSAARQHELEVEREKLKLELTQVHSELERLKDLAGRSQADLQNAKERLQREARDMRRFAMESVIQSLLPTVDSFDRALKHLPDDLRSHNWVVGVAAIERDLQGKLQSLGLRKIECFGQMVDPMKHEILQTGPGEEGRILEVFDDGYELNGKVLRPAKVKVGAGVTGNPPQSASGG